jgi:hypothetical protein
MTQKIKTLFFFFTVTLLISSCATSNMVYKHEQLMLQMNDAQFQVHGTTLEQRKKSFNALSLKQNLLRLDDGSMVAYEEVRTDMQYHFYHTTRRSIEILFNARVIKYYYKRHLYAFQVLLKDNRVINVLARQSHDKQLKIVYGLSTEKLNRILKRLDTNAPTFTDNNVIDLNHEPTPLMTQWTVWNIHFVPLIMPRRHGRHAHII